jgi:hypothetical protein
LIAFNSRCTTSLAEILTRKAGGEHVDLRNGLDGSNIGLDSNTWEGSSQNGLCTGINLTQEFGLV